MKKPLFVLRREREYYWGLALLAASCLTLVWALWRDAFKPEVFLGGLLVFSWGYALLWRNDLQQRLAALEEGMDNLRAELAKANQSSGVLEENAGTEEALLVAEPPAELMTEPRTEPYDLLDLEKKIEES